MVVGTYDAGLAAAAQSKATATPSTTRAALRFLPAEASPLRPFNRRGADSASMVA